MCVVTPVSQFLREYREKLSKKCSSGETATVTPVHLVPVIDYLIEGLLTKTPKSLVGILPDGSHEMLVKTKAGLQSLPEVDLCTDSGVEEAKVAIMPQIADSLLTLRLAFDRNCPAYRSWLLTDEGKTFLDGFKGTLDKVLA